MTVKKPGTNAAAIIRGGRLPERTTQVCLAADLVDEWESLERQAAEMERGDSLVDPAAGVKASMAELRQQMAESTVAFTFRALPRRKWRELYAAHPPRKNPDGSVFKRDQLLGVHYEEFFDALLKASIISPELDDETLDLLLTEKLTDRQWEGLTDVAWNLNRGAVNVPFSLADSQTPRTS